MKRSISKILSQQTNVIRRCIGLLVVGIALNLGALSVAQAATDCNAVTEISPAECKSLLELYNSTNGANWKNNEGWNVTNTPCSWKGITCKNNGVTEIFLSGNQLTGTIPDFSALPNLTKLYLYSNQLTGTIPNFSALPNLTVLYLHSNKLTGTIPNFSALSNLTGLRLKENGLTGTIPNFSALPNLTELSLHYNQLTGTIPNFSALPNLTTLALYSNQLTGTIPNFSALPNLETLSISGNQLTGTIPNFSALPNLQWLALSGNQLTGAIPGSNTFINLTFLDIRNNPLCKGININYSIWPIIQAQWNDDTSWQEQLNEFPSCDQSPTAEFTISPSQGNAPLTVTLDASNSVDPFGSISSYTWTINGQTFSGKTKEKTFNEPGEHIIVLTVKDNDGNEATAQKTVTVINQVPTASFTASPLSGKAPLTVKLDASASKDTDGTIANYKWTSSDGKTLSGVKPTITFSKAGAYTIGLVVTDNNGAKSTNTAQQSIKVESQRYTLTINNTGNGDVTGNGINCGSDCNEEYVENTSVTLTAKADADSIFDGWGGACSGKGNCTVTMNQAQNVTATFDLIPPNSLKVTTQGNGTVTSLPSGINCGADCEEPYRPNTTVTLTANPNADYTFVGWGGACSGTSNCTVTMNQAKNVIATFEQKPIDKFLLTISPTGNGNGIVTSSPSGINCGSGGNDCGEEYDNSPVITLKAKADADSIFEGWGDDCSGDAATCVVEMSSDKTVTARFDLCKYTVKPTSNTHKFNADNGSITVEVSNDKCPWTAISHNDDWLKITSSQDNHGDGEIDYSVADNSNTVPREGKLTIAGQEVTIYQGIYEKPIASLTATPLSGMAPLTVKLDASDSYDSDGEIVSYEWTSDEQTASGETAELTFAGDKSCHPTITLTVTDNDDLSAQAEETISIENCAIVEFQGIEDYYKVGNFVRAEVKIDVNVGRFKRVDLWVAVSMPSGDLIYRTPLGINSFSPVAQAFKESLESQTVTHRLLDFEVPAGLGGIYTFYALIVDEGENPMEHLDELVIQETALANE
jgi:PKD repeat protein